MRAVFTDLVTNDVSLLTPTPFVFILSSQSTFTCDCLSNIHIPLCKILYYYYYYLILPVRHWKGYTEGVSL